MNEDEQRQHAYRALDTAATRMGANNYQDGIKKHVASGKKAHTYRYQPTPAHRLIVESMPKVLTGELSPSNAMALLHTYEVEHERLGI